MKCSGIYQDFYIKREGEFVSRKGDTADFSKRYLKPALPKVGTGRKEIFKI